MPLPSAPLRENQGHETDRFAAAQPSVSGDIHGETYQVNSEIETVTSKFSFASLLIGDFLQGALFVALNGPILFAAATTGEVPGGLLDAYGKAVRGATALPSKSESQLLWIIVFLVMCLVVAKVLDPPAKVVGIVLAKFLKSRGYSGFSSYDFAAETYPHYLARLMRDPFAKAHWEWELFLFYQRCSATVTFAVWLSLLGWMRYQYWGPYFNLAYALEACVAVLLFIAVLTIAVEGSKGMRRTHDLYADLPELPHKRSNYG